MDTLLLLVDQYVGEPLGGLVLAASSPAITWSTDRTTSIRASWYLSPNQHGVEFVLFNAIILTCFLYFSRIAIRDNHRQIQCFIAARDEYLGRDRKRLLWIQRTERALRLLLVGCFAAMVVYKSRSGTQWFLLQPCHADVLTYVGLLSGGGTGLLLLSSKSSKLSKSSSKSLKSPASSSSSSWSWSSPTSWGDPRRPASHFLFNLVVHHCWGTVMALLRPDFRDNRQLGEVPMFWLEHLLLLVAPLLLMGTHRYQLLAPSLPMIMAAFFSFAAYHSLILSPASWISGNNLNYLMSPPPGILEHFGRAYRAVMYSACFLITVFTRYVLLAGAEKLVNLLRDPIP